MLIGKRRPRCHDEMPKRFVLFHLLNHPRQELESLIWLKHDDARFPQPSIERAMIPQRCANKLCISPERVSQAVFHVFTSSARLRMIPLVYVWFTSISYPIIRATARIRIWLLTYTVSLINRQRRRPRQIECPLSPDKGRHPADQLLSHLR
jgi:hypothetical protein